MKSQVKSLTAVEEEKEPDRSVEGVHTKSTMEAPRAQTIKGIQKLRKERAGRLFS
jgi:hypothetical protein